MFVRAPTSFGSLPRCHERSELVELEIVVSPVHNSFQAVKDRNAASREEAELAWASPNGVKVVTPSNLFIQLIFPYISNVWSFNH